MLEISHGSDFEVMQVLRARMTPGTYTDSEDEGEEEMDDEEDEDDLDLEDVEDEEDGEEDEFGDQSV